MMRVKDLAEKKLIDRLTTLVKISTTPKLAKYDDVFYLESMNKGNVVIHTDMLVGKTDVPSIMELYHVGVKSVIMNVSDLIVKGVVPRGMIVSLGLPGNMLLNDFDSMIKGIGETAEKYGIKYIGGDLNEADDLIVDITMIGFHEDVLIPRNGIKSRNVVASTGEFGFTTAGLYLVLNGFAGKCNKKYTPFLNAVLKPALNYDAILNIARRKGIIASIDSSDGLSACLMDLLDVNDYGFLIDNAPVNALIKDFSADYKFPVPDLLFNGGEEYHAIFIIDEEYWNEIKDYSIKNGYYLEKLGRVIEEKKVYYKDSSTGLTRAITKRGFEHFNPQLP